MRIKISRICRSLLNTVGFILLKENKGGKPLHSCTTYAILRIADLVAELDTTSKVCNRFLLINNISVFFCDIALIWGSSCELRI